MVFVAVVADLKKGRYFGLLLYPDSESYDCNAVLYDCMSYFNECSYILHDSDYNEDGELKKPHYHVVCKKGSGVNLTTIQNRYGKLGVLSNHIYIITSYKQQLRYLLHLDDKEKAQYSSDEVESNVVDLAKYFNQKPEGLQVLDMVDERLNGMSYRQIIECAVKNGTYDVFRKNLGIIQLVVQEEFGRELVSHGFIEEDIPDVVKRFVY